MPGELRTVLLVEEIARRYHVLPTDVYVAPARLLRHYAIVKEYDDGR